MWVLLSLWALPLFAQTSTWVTLQNCTLKPQEYNDGDSFHIMHQGQEYIFRLYFVDCPETMVSLNQRMAEQAQYWGISDTQILDLGHQATEFTRKFLTRGSITVMTCWQKALGRSALQRYYAYISVLNQDLGSELVRNGLAQVYGEQRKAQGMYNSKQVLARLLRNESEAKKFRRGAWNLLPMNSPLMTNRGVRQTSEGAAYVIPWGAAVYALANPQQQLGRLRENTVVWLLEERADGYVRIRYEPDNGGEPIEFLARRIDLGLPASPVLQSSST